jgi:hypothetical protein
MSKIEKCVNEIWMPPPFQAKVIRGITQELYVEYKTN